MIRRVLSLFRRKKPPAGCDCFSRRDWSDIRVDLTVEPVMYSWTCKSCGTPYRASASPLTFKPRG